MSVFDIPLNSTQQEFEIDLNKVTYKMRVYFNKAAGAWMLDLFGPNKTALIRGQPLVTGANLLDSYAYHGIGGTLMLYTDGDQDKMPGLDELGKDTRMLFIQYQQQG